MVQTQSQRISHATKGRLVIKIADVRERIFGLFGYDAKLPVRKCQHEGIDVRGRELEYAHYFYEVCFRELVRDPADREKMVELIAMVEIEFKNVMIDGGNLIGCGRPGPKSQVKRKDLLLDEVVEEEVELKFVSEGLGLSRKKRVGSKLKKVQKYQSTRLMVGVDDGKNRGIGGKVAEEWSAAEGNLKEVDKWARLATFHGEEDMSKMARVNLEEVAAEHERLGRHLILKGYSEDEVNAIKTVLDNEGDDTELPEGENEKIRKERPGWMSTSILYLDSQHWSNLVETRIGVILRKLDNKMESSEFIKHGLYIKLIMLLLCLSRESELDKDDGSADKTSKKKKKRKLAKGSAYSGIEIVGPEVDEDGKMDEVPDLVPNNDMVSKVDTEGSNGSADKGSKKTKKSKKASGETKSSKKKKNETTDSDTLEFEKVAAEVGMDVDGGSSFGSPHTPVNGTLLKKRKTAKSSNAKKNSRGEGVNENSDVGKWWNERKEVPPSATPRGHALRKGVPAGPVRKMPIKDLQRSLKAICEDFITSITKAVVDPMLSFITKVMVKKASLSVGNQSQKETRLNVAKPLKKNICYSNKAARICLD
ncbi:hypothetical protein GIB67_003845, partial [Kingdonia uniflora]